MSRTVTIFFTPAQAGREFDPPITAAAVRAACNRGEIAVVARTADGGRLIDPDEIGRVRRQRAARIAERRRRS